MIFVQRRMYLSLMRGNVSNEIFSNSISNVTCTAAGRKIVNDHRRGYSNYLRNQISWLQRMPSHYRLLLGSQLIFLVYAHHWRRKAFRKHEAEILEQELLNNPFVANDLRLTPHQTRKATP
jgi:hypothetical protein